MAESNLSHPHNIVLHFWLALGLPGLVAAGWLVGRALVLARVIAANTADPLWRALALGATASLMDFLVHGMIDNSYFLPDLAIVFWLTLAVLEAGRRADSWERGPPFGRLRTSLARPGPALPTPSDARRRRVAGSVTTARDGPGLSWACRMEARAPRNRTPSALASPRHLQLPVL